MICGQFPGFGSLKRAAWLFGFPLPENRHAASRPGRHDELSPEASGDLKARQSLAARVAARLRPEAHGAPDPRPILDSIGQTVYDWDLHSDRIQWGPNAAAVLGVRRSNRSRPAALTPNGCRMTAKARASTPFPIHRHRRGRGRPFQICYGLVPPDGPRDATIWIEDAGRWFAGPTAGRRARMAWCAWSPTATSRNANWR